MIHHRKPNRLQGYDYSRDNLYFVTSCVHNRVCCFGDIVVVGSGRDLTLQQQRDLTLQQQRDLALQQRDQTYPTVPDLPKQQMKLNEYGKIAEKQWYWLAEQYPYVVLHEFIVMPDHIHGILEIDHTRVFKTIKIKSLSELMGAYKTTVSKQIHMMECADQSCSAGTTLFKWQRSFYDSIIRDPESYERISDYIINNPLNWKQDKFYNT